MRINWRSAWQHAEHAWARLTGAKDVYIHHSVTRISPRATWGEERAHVRELDNVAHNRGFLGISYNFVVFPSGRIWAGRGWKFVGAHNDGENSSSYGIVLVGNFENEQPTDAAIESLRYLIREGQRLGRIRKRRLRIRGHRDSDATACPGTNLYRQIPRVKAGFDVA